MAFRSILLVTPRRDECRGGSPVCARPRPAPTRPFRPPFRAETDRPGPKWLVSVPQRRGAGPYCQPRSRRSAGSLVCGLDGMSWPPRSCDTSWLYSYAYTVHGSSGVGIGHAVYMRYTLCLNSCVVGQRLAARLLVVDHVALLHAETQARRRFILIESIDKARSPASRVCHSVLACAVVLWIGRGAERQFI